MEDRGIRKQEERIEGRKWGNKRWKKGEYEGKREEGKKGENERT